MTIRRTLAEHLRRNLTPIAGRRWHVKVAIQIAPNPGWQNRTYTVEGATEPIAYEAAKTAAEAERCTAICWMESTEIEGEGQ